MNIQSYTNYSLREGKHRKNGQVYAENGADLFFIRNAATILVLYILSLNTLQHFSSKYDSNLNKNNSAYLEKLMFIGRHNLILNSINSGDKDKYSKLILRFGMNLENSIKYLRKN